MIYRLLDLLSDDHPMTEVAPRVWVPARPLSGPLAWRIRAAWAVLRGRADAVLWPEDDPSQWEPPEPPPFTVPDHTPGFLPLDQYPEGEEGGDG